MSWPGRSCLPRRQDLFGLDLAVLSLNLSLEGGGGLLECLAAGQGLAREILFTFFEGKLSALVPGFGLRFRLIGLITQTFLAGDGHGNRLSQFHKVRLHVSDGLIQDLGWILHAADGGIGVGAHQAAEPVKETHGEGWNLAEASEIHADLPLIFVLWQ